MSAPLNTASLVSSWREAMEGVTPGPWQMEVEAEDRVAESEEDRQPEVYVCSAQTSCDCTVVATMGRAESIPHMRKSFDADWIARCSPSGISALLDALESTSRALSEKEACERAFLDELGDPAIDGWNSAAEKLKAVLDAVEENEKSDQAALAEATRQRDEDLAALKASEERGERLSSELASARLRPEPSTVGLHAQITPFSSVVGQSVLLVDEAGKAVAQLSISVPDPSKPYRETAEEIARVIELAINEPPSEEVKRLRLRLGDLMMEDAKRMAALENGPPALADATNKDPGTEQREAGV